VFKWIKCKLAIGHTPRDASQPSEWVAGECQDDSGVGNFRGQVQQRPAKVSKVALRVVKFVRCFPMVVCNDSPAATKRKNAIKL
jgi:hypothetical protein